MRKIVKILLLTIICLILMTVSLQSQYRYELTANRTDYEVTNDIFTRIKIATATSQLGITEENNRKQILIYLQSVDKYYLTPWCAAFQYWVNLQVCNITHVENVYPKSGLANMLFNYAKIKGKRTKYIPEKGDYIVWKIANQVFGHIGLIVDISKSYVTTIEGNTSSFSVRTGGAVMEKRRHIMHAIGKLKVRGLVGMKVK